MKKQSKLQLAKKEYDEVLKIFYEVRKKDVIVDFKIRKKGISHQLDLLDVRSFTQHELKIKKARGYYPNQRPPYTTKTSSTNEMSQN